MAEETVRTGRRRFLTQGGAALVGVALAATPAKAQGAGTPRWCMVIDLRRCIGCRACTVACKAEMGTPLGVWRSAVIQKDVGSFPDVARYFLPLLCNHCAAEDLPCVDVCPGDEQTDVYTAPDGTEVEYTHRASHRRPDGVVSVNPELCIGCGACIFACPYGARFFDPGTKAGSSRAIGEQAAAKCTYCLHRVDEGLVPACVQTCQGKARIFGDLNDADSEVSRLLAEHEVEHLLTEEGTEPQTFYIGYVEGVYERWPKGGNMRDGI